MSCADGRISHRQWIDYTDGRLGANEKNGLEAHLESCRECRELCRSLLAVHERLGEASRRSAVAAAVSERSLPRIWDGVRFRIRRAAAKPSKNTITLDQLRSIVSSLCGRAAADGALRQAAIDSGHPEHFEHLAGTLRPLVAVLCGDKAARFVTHAARRLDEDQVA